MQITARRVALFHYTLTNEAGEVLDSSVQRQPLAYLHGAGNIVPGLEKSMEGRKAGDHFQVEVAPGEGYGERHDALVQTVPRDSFRGVESVEPGMQFQAQGDGGTMPVTVTRVEAGQVTVDGNHPLAGQTLHFDVRVAEVRDATPEELEHGHAHGAGGAH